MKDFKTSIFDFMTAQNTDDIDITFQYSINNENLVDYRSGILMYCV